MLMESLFPWNKRIAIPRNCKDKALKLLLSFLRSGMRSKLVSLCLILFPFLTFLHKLVEFFRHMWKDHFSYRRQLLQLCANNALSTAAKLPHHHHCWYRRKHAFYYLPKNCKDKFCSQCRSERWKYFPLSFTKKSCKRGPKETETEIFLTQILRICSNRSEMSKMICGRSHFFIVEYY